MEHCASISRCVLISGYGLSVGVLGVVSEAFLHYSRRVCASVFYVFTILMQSIVKTCRLGKGTSHLSLNSIPSPYSDFTSTLCGPFIFYSMILLTGLSLLVHGFIFLVFPSVLSCPVPVGSVTGML